MKKLLRGLAVALILFLTLSTVVLADTWSYYITVTVKDTSATNRTNVPVLTGMSGGGFYSLGFIDSDGLDTRLFESTGATDVSGQLLGTTQYAFVIPTLSANQTRTYRFYLNYAPDRTGFPVVVGSGGYLTTSDNASLEAGADFEYEIDGYINSATVGARLLYKPATLDWYVSSAGNLTANIYGAVGAQLSQGAGTNEWERVGGTTQKRGQVYTTAVDLWITTIQVYGEEEGTAPGNFEISLESTSGGIPTGTTLATANLRPASDFPAAGAPALVTFTFATPYFIQAGTTFAVVARETATTDDTNNIHLFYDAASDFDGSRYYISSGNWTIETSNPTFDMRFIINGAVPAKTVTGGVASGEHDLKLTATGGNFKMYDGALQLDTEALGGVSVQNTAYDYKWMASNSVPYADKIKATVGGVVQYTYQPVSMITGSTITDETNAFDGTITWGANSGMTVTIGALVPYDSVEASAGGSGSVADTVPDAPVPGNWYAAGTGAGLPFYTTFNSAATSIGWTTQTLYLYVLLGMAVVIGLGVLLFTGSTLMAILGCGVMMGFGVNMQIVSGWMMMVYISLAVGILFLARKA